MANDITVTFEPQTSFYQKTDATLHKAIIKETLESSSETLLEFIKEEAPVRTGRLRDGHYIETRGDWVNIKNEAYYWKYVIALGNDYINRGLLEFINTQTIQTNYTELIMSYL